MAVVRILVDGYSLLHAWRDLAPNARVIRPAPARRSSACSPNTPTASAPLSLSSSMEPERPRMLPKNISPDALEVVFSRDSKTADDLIERTAYRLKPYGEALAVTNDFAERDTVISMGGLAQSCEDLLRDIDRVLKERDDFVKVHNRREANRYKR